MADWFEHDVDLHEHHKVKALCSRLREPLADAYVGRIYGYCYKQVLDRFDAESARETIEDAARWKGRRGVLFDALFACEFLERDGQKIVVHGVADRLAPHMARKAAAKERQRKHREKVARLAAERAGIAAPVTPHVTRDVTSDVTPLSRPPTTDTNTNTNNVALTSNGACVTPIRPLGVHVQGNHPLLCEAVAAAGRAGVGINVGRKAAAWGEAEGFIKAAGLEPVVAAWVESARKREGDIASVPLAYVLPATRSLVQRGTGPPKGGRPDLSTMDYTKPPEW